MEVFSELELLSSFVSSKSSLALRNVVLGVESDFSAITDGVSGAVIYSFVAESCDVDKSSSSSSSSSCCFLPSSSIFILKLLLNSFILSSSFILFCSASFIALSWDSDINLITF